MLIRAPLLSLGANLTICKCAPRGEERCSNEHSLSSFFQSSALLGSFSPTLTLEFETHNQWVLTNHTSPLLGCKVDYMQMCTQRRGEVFLVSTHWVSNSRVVKWVRDHVEASLSHTNPRVCKNANCITTPKFQRCDNSSISFDRRSVRVFVVYVHYSCRGIWERNELR